MAEHNIVLDLKAEAAQDSVWLEMRQGERGSEIISAVILDDGEPADLTGCTASFNCITPDGCTVADPACAIEGNIVTYTVSKYVLASSGLIKLAYIDIMHEGEYIDSAGTIQIAVLPSIANCIPEDYFGTLNEVIGQHFAAIKSLNQTISTFSLFVQDAVERANAAAAACEEIALNENQRQINEEVRQEAERRRQYIYAYILSRFGSIQSAIDHLASLHGEYALLYAAGALRINEGASIANSAITISGAKSVDGSLRFDRKIFGLRRSNGRIIPEPHR